MMFSEEEEEALKTVITAIGAGLAVWGMINLLEAYRCENITSRNKGIEQFKIGSDIVAIAQAGVLAADDPLFINCLQQKTGKIGDQSCMTAEKTWSCREEEEM